MTAPTPEPHAPGAGAPSAWVARFAPLLRAHGPVLDVAAGAGRHARLLAGLGHPVLAVDRDAAALAALAGAAGVTALAADLESAPWPLAGRTFDGVVVTNYLHRPLFPALAAAVAPGGLLLCETFMQGHERYGRPSNPAFLLAPGELLLAFPELAVVAFEQGLVEGPAPRVVQRLCAWRPDGGPAPGLAG